MAKVRLSRLADADLADLLIFGEARFGLAAAESYVRSFDSPLELLGRYTSIGMQAFEDDPVTRVLHHRRHRIFYELEEEDVLILRVLHHAMEAHRRVRRRGGASV